MRSEESGKAAIRGAGWRALPVALWIGIGIALTAVFCWLVAERRARNVATIAQQFEDLALRSATYNEVLNQFRKPGVQRRISYFYAEHDVLTQLVIEIESSALDKLRSYIYRKTGFQVLRPDSRDVGHMYFIGDKFLSSGNYILRTEHPEYKEPDYGPAGPPPL